MAAADKTVQDSTGSAHAEVRLWGYLAQFDSPESLLAAAKRVRDAGYARWDAHTPFPVHGLNDAMGLRPTRLPWIVLAAGFAGAATGLVLQWFTNAFDYPLLISGKPIFSLPANIPVMFELTILFAAVAAFVGMLGLNGLPRPYHALFRSRRFRRTTTDGFFISIEASDPKFEPAGTKRFLQALSGTEIETIEEEE